VQLVDVAGDRALWSDSFEGLSDDVLSLQDSLAVAITSGLRGAIPKPSGNTP
jgi:TolB-like protein